MKKAQNFWRMCRGIFRARIVNYLKATKVGKQLQALKEEIINLTQMRLKETFPPFCKETQK